MIASPSDVSTERVAARDVILDWNAANSMVTSVVLEPILWETHANPEMGRRPQAIINRQLVDSADLLIAVFWTRIGSPTGVAASGTIEEMERFIKSKRHVLLYFSSQDVPADINIEQLRLVRDFRDRCKKRGLYRTYHNLSDFRQSLALHVAGIMSKLIESSTRRELQVTYPKKTEPGKSLWSFKADAARLRLQADNLVKLDREGIKYAMSFLHSHGARKLHVIDVGCADGYVTTSRFGNLSDVTVHGIDIDEECIETANRKYLRDGFSYTVGDVESGGKKVVEPCDIIFCGETLHHLRNPEGVLHQLWTRLRSPGALIVRSSDDGFKLTYPEDDNLSWLLKTTNEIKGGSDRQHGRKIYSHMIGLTPEPAEIRMFFQADSTVGMSEEERRHFFDDNHGFRSMYAEELLKSPETQSYYQPFVENIRRVLASQRERFVERRNLFSLNVQNIAIACKLDSRARTKGAARRGVSLRSGSPDRTSSSRPRSRAPRR